MIYLDNAATTFPKPPAVTEEVRKCMTYYCGNPGRSGHSLSVRAAQAVFECRELAADMFGASDTDRVFFTQNATHGINTVLKGLLRQGDHVIISDIEHNAVWRPIHKMSAEGKISYDVFKTFTGDARKTPTRICAAIAKLIRPNTRLVFCTHASNICSATLPIKEIGDFCHRHGILFCVDGAQSAGQTYINVEKMNVSALCLPGHKGLYGPQGSGMVILGKDLMLNTLTEGGNGIDSLSPEMPQDAPERYEAGTLSTPCIAGLYAGLKSVRDYGVEAISEMELKLGKRLSYVLSNMDGVTVYPPNCYGGIVLFNVNGIPSEVVSSELDKCGICVRGGYHCAPLAHKTLGTPDGGAVRVSFGIFNRATDIDVFYKALCDIK